MWPVWRLLLCGNWIILLGRGKCRKLPCYSTAISPDPSLVVTRLSDWGWRVNLSGDLLSTEWWHHDKAECHHFVVPGKEIGHEMADSWTSLHDAKAALCPTTLPRFRQGGFEPTFDRCPCISHLCAPVREEKKLHEVPNLCSDNKGECLLYSWKHFRKHGKCSCST